MSSARESGPQLPPIAVLLVEDEPIIALDVKRKLLRLGCERVATAVAGAEAIELAEGSRPDVVIMDIGLRGEMDGATAATIIHERYGIPIIFASAYRDRGSSSRAEAAAPVSWLLKPFTTEDLQLSIMAALASRKRG